MNEQTINFLVEEYTRLNESEKEYRKDLVNQIKKLNEDFSESLNKSIYKLIYKEEYGDYRKFVESIAEKMRG